MCRERVAAAGAAAAVLGRELLHSSDSPTVEWTLKINIRGRTLENFEVTATECEEATLDR